MIDSDFHDDETTTSYRDATTLCGATPTCSEPGSFSDAQGHASCRDHGGVAPRNLPADVRSLVASAATRRDYGAIARILGDADVDLAWLAEELTQTARPRAHALAVDLVRLGVEPHLLVPSLPPATVDASPRAQLRRDRVARAVRALHCGPTVDSVPDELRDCYRRCGELRLILTDVERGQDALRRLVAQYLRVRDQPEADLLAILKAEIEREEKGEWMPTYHDWVTERRNAADLAAERDVLRQRVAELEGRVQSRTAYARTQVAALNHLVENHVQGSHKGEALVCLRNLDEALLDL